MKQLKRISVLVLALVMALTVYFPAKAAATVNETSQTYVIANKGKEVYQWDFYNKNKVDGTYRNRETDKSGFVFVTTSDETTDIKSSNTSVLTVKSVKRVTNDGYQQYTSYDIYVHPKKAGSATVTWTSAGEKHVLKTTVVSYSSPVKTLKIGSKSYASKVKSTPKATCSGTVKGKVTIKTNKNWSVKKIRKFKGSMTAIWSGYTNYSFSGKSTIKSKKSVSLKSSSEVLQVTFYNSKTKQYSVVWISSSGNLKYINRVAG